MKYLRIGIVVCEAAPSVPLPECKV